MNKWLVFLTCLLLNNSVQAQDIRTRLDSAMQQFSADTQLLHASIGMYVADASTDAPIYDYHANTGLSPASTQKIFTAIAAYDLLGQEYRFKTFVGYNGSLDSGILNGDLIIKGLGDPTLGSWRYPGYKPANVKNKILGLLEKSGIKSINGNVIVDETTFPIQPAPGGWPWNDLGNYYGAPNWGLNWGENQFEITFKPGRSIGDTTIIFNIDPTLPNITFANEVITNTADAGDESYIFSSPYNNIVIASGSVPKGKNTTAAASVPNPPALFSSQLQAWFAENNITLTGSFQTGGSLQLQGKKIPQLVVILDTLQSPPMDSIIYFFLRKSVNLYGESFAKVIGWEKKHSANTIAGVDLIREYWVTKGLDKTAVRMIDGSGLSPQNYDTPFAEVFALLYAKKQPWFSAFYNAIPTYNDMKMKSGTINVSKAFTGYQTSKDGKKYVFSIIVNNYNGNGNTFLKKLYKVLDVLK